MDIKNKFSSKEAWAHAMIPLGILEDASVHRIRLKKMSLSRLLIDPLCSVTLKLQDPELTSKAAEELALNSQLREVFIASRDTSIDSLTALGDSKSLTTITYEGELSLIDSWINRAAPCFHGLNRLSLGDHIFSDAQLIQLSSLTPNLRSLAFRIGNINDPSYPVLPAQSDWLQLRSLVIRTAAFEPGAENFLLTAIDVARLFPALERLTLDASVEFNRTRFSPEVLNKFANVASLRVVRLVDSDVRTLSVLSNFKRLDEFALHRCRFVGRYEHKPAFAPIWATTSLRKLSLDNVTFRYVSCVCADRR